MLICPFLRVKIKPFSLSSYFSITWSGICCSNGGSKISLYLDTIRTETKYTIANAKNCACLASSFNKKVYIYLFLCFNL